MSDDVREYVDDDYCPDRDPRKVLVMTVAGYDYFLGTVQDPRVIEDGDFLGAQIGEAQIGPMVRIRTSGSSDPRNAAVCRALRDLWRALQGESGDERL